MHLEGTPAEIGFQHGYLLAAEIKDTFKAVSTRDGPRREEGLGVLPQGRARGLLAARGSRSTARNCTGIVEGLKARGVKLDIWDIVAINAWLELPYYDKWHDKRTGKASDQRPRPGEHCSAFVATGSYTKDGRIVIGHNNWTSYAYRRTLEHHLRHRARRMATASSWTACPA